MMSKVGGSTDGILLVGAVVDANKSFGGGVFRLALPPDVRIMR